MLYEQDDPKGILRTFFDFCLRPYQPSHKLKGVLGTCTTNHLPKITKSFSCLTCFKGVGKGLNRVSHLALVSLASTVKQFCCIPPTQTEMFSCLTLEKASPGTAIELTAEEHNCLLQ